MRNRNRCVVGLLLFALGYSAGQLQVFRPQFVHAQDDGFSLSDETIQRLRQTHSALRSAMSALETENEYTSAIVGINALGISIGGLDAKQDLEDGRGVDPETFAGLYAGLATEDVKLHLKTDEQGRLTYKGELIRMYSPSRLKRMFAQRERVAAGALETP